VAVELDRWGREADALATAWRAPVAEGRHAHLIRIERDGDRSFLQIGYGDGGPPEAVGRTEIELRPRGAQPAEPADVRLWRDLVAHSRSNSVALDEDARRGHESAAAAALWAGRPFESLVADRRVSEFTLLRRGDDTVVSFIDDWAGQRELIELAIWVAHEGGIPADAVGNFWLALAEGTVTGTPLP
jgi:hypothetical protein